MNKEKEQVKIGLDMQKREACVHGTRDRGECTAPN